MSKNSCTATNSTLVRFCEWRRLNCYDYEDTIQKGKQNMKKYEEEHYLFEHIKDKIYPWVKSELFDSKALNGKNFSEKDTPVIEFVGGLKIIFAIKRGEEIYEILKDNMLPPNTDIEELYHTACENLVRDVEFVIGNTWYGGYGIIADGIHEASAVCFKHIWQVCVDKLKDDLIIAVPAKETVLFVPASDAKGIEKLKEDIRSAYHMGRDGISKSLFRFSKSGKELTVYEV